MLLEHKEKCYLDATSLLQASQKGHVDACTMSLEHNENANEEMEDGVTYSFQAAQNGHMLTYVLC